MAIKTPDPSRKQLRKIEKSEMTLEKVNETRKEVYGNKTTKNIGVRVNRYVYSKYKNENDYLPITAAIEAGMIYFLTLSHSERIKFLNDYSAKNVKIKDLKDVNEKFDEFISRLLEESYIPESVIDKMNIEDKIKTVLNIISSKEQ